MKMKYCCGKPSAVMVAFFLLLFTSCDMFEYSPYEVRLQPEDRKINEQHIARIQNLKISPADTLRVALTADTQGFYADNDDMVNHLNRRHDVAFVLHGGDITDYGLLKEFGWVHRSLKRLAVPYVAVIGNHDAVGNGQQVYKAMFGEFDFTFSVAGNKFIFLNTNYLEFDQQAPDLNWLEEQLQDRESYTNVFVVSHIPPNSPEFGAHNKERYQHLLKKYNVSLSIHGHTHSYDYYKLEEEGINHLNVASTDNREYMVMQIVGDKYQLERIHF
ncbi:metallophosphoesterase family protein [Pontibacter beigongshangensis]|uniref:metallophosphoesterase family protein n=1 Tax=Pontibacter beigongshangensis TaxID=2574733 RepID=UPI00164F1647|nr:metallophosphoesterase [Pontibacter beigongshangensis]